MAIFILTKIVYSVQKEIHFLKMYIEIYYI